MTNVTCLIVLLILGPLSEDPLPPGSLRPCHLCWKGLPWAADCGWGMIDSFECTEVSSVSVKLQLPNFNKNEHNLNLV